MKEKRYKEKKNERNLLFLVYKFYAKKKNTIDLVINLIGSFN